MKRYKAITKIVLVVLLILVSGCSTSERIDETIYTTNINNSNNITTGGVVYTGGNWEEIVTPANAMGEGWPAPTASNAQSGFVYLFADYVLDTDEQFLHFTMQMPHSWKEGTDIIPSIRFIYNSDQVGTCVRWRMEYSWANVGGNFPVSTHVYKLSDPSNNDSLKHQIVKFDPIDGTGKEIGSILMCFLSRNSSYATDNYTDTAIFVAVTMDYQVDTSGSSNEWSK